MNDRGRADDLTALATEARTDPAAMGRLLDRLVAERTLQGVIRRYVFNEDDVAMVEQQTLLVVAFKLDRWSGRGDFGPWIRQAAANEAKMLIRSRERRRHHEEEAATNRTAAFVDRISSRLATEADLERCLLALEPDLEAPLRLRRSGYSYGDIAAALGIAEGTAKTRVRRARQALAAALLDGRTR
ncbi:MAG: RNA polymerase sigma factor [Actinomycetota bacterium]